MFKGDDVGHFQSLSRECRMTRIGGDCYLYCMLASGLHRRCRRGQPEAVRHRAAGADHPGGGRRRYHMGRRRSRQWRTDPRRGRSGAARAGHAGACGLTSRRCRCRPSLTRPETPRFNKSITPRYGSVAIAAPVKAAGGHDGENAGHEAFALWSRRKRAARHGRRRGQDP